MPRNAMAAVAGGPAARRARNVALANIRSGGLLGIETKFLDIALVNRILQTPTDASGGELQPTAGCTGCLTAPEQGDGPTQRDGKKIIIKSVLLQGTINVAAQSAQSAADLIPMVYLALVQDTQTNGVTINSEDVFTNISADADNAALPFRNMSNTSRFKVLKQWSRKLIMPSITNNTTAGSIVQSGYNVPFTISWKGLMPVNFSTTGTTANVSTVTDNSIHLIGFVSGQNVQAAVDAGCRVRFVG